MESWSLVMGTQLRWRSATRDTERAERLICPVTISWERLKIHIQSIQGVLDLRFHVSLDPEWPCTRTSCRFIHAGVLGKYLSCCIRFVFFSFSFSSSDSEHITREREREEGGSFEKDVSLDMIKDTDSPACAPLTYFTYQLADLFYITLWMNS